jgi:hypothetical protein
MSDNESASGKGRPRRPARRPAPRDPSLEPPECYGPLGRDIGGYSNLAFALIRLDRTLYVDPGTLPEIDAMIDANPEVFERLEWELGIFYGHVITHTFLRAQWEPPSGGNQPAVRIGDRLLIEVMAIANRRLTEENVTLERNFAYLRRAADKYTWQ